LESANSTPWALESNLPVQWYGGEDDDAGGTGAELEGAWAGTVLDGGPQWKPTEWTPIEQPGGAFFPGLKVTLFAPPHWEFWKMAPPWEQEWVSWQVEPSGMLYSQSMSAS
jgi:hypothetical protein